jgi:hypothetical protein
VWCCSPAVALLQLAYRPAPVPPLKDDAALQLLRVNGLQLSDAQSRVVLRYCAGLPLALLIVQGTLERADSARIADVCA